MMRLFFFSSFCFSNNTYRDDTVAVTEPCLFSLSCSVAADFFFFEGSHFFNGF